MAALSLTVPTGPGAIATPASASASDTLSQAVIGANGVNLRIQTAGTSSNVTISDGGATPASNPATVTAIAMAATQVRYAYISPAQVNLGTGLVTITSSSQTNLTYEVTPS